MNVTTRRIRAYVLDQLIVLVLLFFPIFMAAELGPWFTTLFLSYGIAYSFLKDSVGGASPGKRAFSIHAIQPERNIPIGPFSAALRNLIFFIPFYGQWDALTFLFGRHQSRATDRQFPREVVLKGPSQTRTATAVPLVTVLIIPILFTVAVKGSPFPHSEKPSVLKAETVWDAAGADNTERLKELLDSGTNPNQTNDSGQTPLQIAVVKGHIDAIKALLEHGADVCAKTNILKPGGETVSEILAELIKLKGQDTELSVEQLTHLKELVDSQKCGGKFDATQFELKSSSVKSPK